MLYSNLICEKILQLPLFKSTAELAVAAYVPFRSEVNIWPILQWLWQHQGVVWLPKVGERAGEMQLYRTSSKHDLSTGKWGLQEPHEHLPQWDETKNLDAVIVPGVAFDRQGRRLGYGAGYYDRFFARLSDQSSPKMRQPLLIAPAFSTQVIAEVPAEEHDRSINLLVTEEYSQYC